MRQGTFIRSIRYPALCLAAALVAGCGGTGGSSELDEDPEITSASQESEEPRSAEGPESAFPDAEPQASCTPGSWEECTPWYDSGESCGTSFCSCCYESFPWHCFHNWFDTCERQYRNCRIASRNHDCSASYGAWYSRWRDHETGCSASGYSCN
ncbi:hypothetical protein [Sorangium sp. So ce131]|uniref:hypothetical protein n=1 Tax=Sorangium sp. So ce131 TaxID=3133282 RepID=UPI003F6038B7